MQCRCGDHSTGTGNFLDRYWAALCIVTIVALLCEAIELPFGMVSGVGPRKNVLEGGPDHPWERGSFGGFVAL